MIVVLDTNVWKQNLYLRSALGTAVRFFLHQSGIRLAIPEVVRLEIQEHLNIDLRNNRSRVQDSYRQLLAAFGELPEVRLPSDSQIEEKVANILSELDLDVLDVPFSLESARDSFLKTVRKQPPSHNSQQFKDGVLWADCVSLLKKDSVTLVSNDTAFYEANDYKKGLSYQLIKEASFTENNFVLMQQLSNLLNEIKQSVAVDRDALANEYLSSEEGKTVVAMVKRNGFTIGALRDSAVSVFATESIRRLAIEYELEFTCPDASGVLRDEATLKIKGDGFYDPSNETFQRLSPLATEISFVNELGEMQRRAGVYVRLGPIVIGHANTSHTIRHKLA